MPVGDGIPKRHMPVGPSAEEYRSLRSGLYRPVSEVVPIIHERTQEALKTNPSTIAVACPYCMTMFEDGVKDEKAQDRVKVKDISEIVAEAIK